MQFDSQKKTKKRNLAEVAFAAVTIQRAYRRYKMKKDGNRKTANKSKYQPQGSSDKTTKKTQVIISFIYTVVKRTCSIRALEENNGQDLN